MANTKEYKIVINGLTESISAVDSLNKQLDNLEQRINDLQGKGVNVSGGGTSLPKASELSEIEKIEREIAKVQEKQAAHQSEEYKALLMEKEALKQIESQAKASAKALAGASNPNEIDLNTMSGIKQRMRDLKLQHNNTDINSDLFKEQTREINELNQKLKELEAEYGVYSRNVGNYANGVAEGYKSAKAELKALKTEMQNLTVKQDRGIISEEEAERLKSLIPTVKQLESSIADAGKPMDAIMDAMQSIVAISQTTKGLSALFGLDDDKIERSIQKLVALQNVMQGIQTLQKQMDTGEGLGAVTKYLDDVVEKSKEGTKSLKAMGTAASFASKAIKGISKAFGWVAIAMTAYDVVSSLFKKTKEASDGTVNYLEREKKYADGMAASYAKGLTTLMEVNAKIKAFNGNAKDEKKLVDELNNTLGDSFGYYKTIAEWKQALIDQSPNYLKTLEAEIKLEMVRGEIAEQMAKIRRLELESQTPYVQQSLDEERQRLNTLLGEYQSVIEAVNELRSNVPSGTTITGNTITKTKKETIDAEKELQNLRLSVMKDGLNKRLMQLDEEKRQTLNKLKKNSQDYLEAEKIYNGLRLEEIKKYQSEVVKTLEEGRKKITEDNLNIQIDEIENNISRLEKSVPYTIKLFTQGEFENFTNSDIYKTLNNYLDLLEKVNEKGFDNLTDEQKEFIKSTEEQCKIELNIIRTYAGLETIALKDSFKTRIDDAREWQRTTLDELTKAIEKERDLKEEQLNEEKNSERNAAAESYKEQRDSYQREIDLAQEQFDALKEIANEGHTNLTDEQRELWKQLQDIILTNQEYIKQSTENFNNELENIEKKHDNAIVKLNLETIEKRSSIQQKYFDTQIENYRDFNSKINQEIQKQPVIYEGGLGIINKKATKQNYKEIESAINATLKGIQEDRNELNAQFSEGLLTPEAYSSTLRQLEDLENSTTDSAELIKENLGDLGGQWWGTINNWLQQLGQATSSILSSLSEITSNHYEKQIDEQQAFIDKYEELLQKQEDITQKHADRVNSIEDELANARGDRRQHLIDQLNAEIQAQRESLKEQEKARKKKEAAEHKQADLEYYQAMARKKMDEAQAKINAAMAISNAAVNHWPIPAIPLIALATAVGAAQVAAVSSQYIPKPKYADGGVIQGKSHKQGGVKVLGGTAEVEGGEFITNKITTTKNVELLEYINSNKKRIDLSDMIEFFNDKPRATIKSIRSKFENGGTLPNIDLTRGGENTIYIKDETPVVVQVVDIMNKADEVRAVRTIAGAN